MYINFKFSEEFEEKFLKTVQESVENHLDTMSDEQLNKLVSECIRGKIQSTCHDILQTKNVRAKLRDMVCKQLNVTLEDAEVVKK